MEFPVAEIHNQSSLCEYFSLEIFSMEGSQIEIMIKDKKKKKKKKI